MTDSLRLEFSPFGIHVIDLETGAIKTNFQSKTKKAALPATSIFWPAKEIVEDRLSGLHFAQTGMDPNEYAKAVVKVILKDVRSLPAQIWKGENAWMVWFAMRFMPLTGLDKDMKKMGRIEGGQGAG